MGENKGNRTIAIGLMLFALFFGAGNLIFPAAMGQAAGSNVWWAVLGFVVTGVGLPLAGVLAMGYSGCKNLQELASRSSPFPVRAASLMKSPSVPSCRAVAMT